MGLMYMDFWIVNLIFGPWPKLEKKKNGLYGPLVKIDIPCVDLVFVILDSSGFSVRQRSETFSRVQHYLQGELSSLY